MKYLLSLFLLIAAAPVFAQTTIIRSVKDVEKLSIYSAYIIESEISDPLEYSKFEVEIENAIKNHLLPKPQIVEDPLFTKMREVLSGVDYEKNMLKFLRKELIAFANHEKVKIGSRDTKREIIEKLKVK